MSLTCNKMSNFPCDSGRSFGSYPLSFRKSYENETLVKNLQKVYFTSTCLRKILAKVITPP